MNPFANRLDERLAQQSLTPDGICVARRLATDPHGILLRSAAAIVAPMINGDDDKAHAVLVELGAKKLLRQDTSGPEPRIFFDHAAIGLTEEEASACLSVLDQLQTIGGPHSTEGMASLKAFFQSESPISLVLSITSHDVFTDLQDRADRGRLTFFVLPSRSCVQQNLHAHYDEVLQNWTTFLVKGNDNLRSNTILRVATVDCAEIYTSGISADLARINFIRSDAQSTREGTVILAPASTSLYALYRARATEVWAAASPLWALEKQRVIFLWLGKVLWPASLVAIALTAVALLGKLVGGLIATIAIGLLRERISLAIGAKAWSHRNLFQR